MLPLFDWRSIDSATAIWTAFLAWGRWNDALLEAGLISGYIEAARRYATFGEEVQKRLVGHIASICLLSDINPFTSGWLTRFTVDVELETRSALWQHIGWELRNLPGEVVEQRWSEWMLPYWTSRLESIPIMLTKAECSAMATWVPLLGANALAAIELAVQYSAGVEQHSHLLHDLAANDILRTSPREATAFVAHLLQGTEAPFYGCNQVAKIIKVVSSTTRQEPTEMIEQALRLGCPASMWEQTSLLTE